eukprot:345652_1
MFRVWKLQKDVNQLNKRFISSVSVSNLYKINQQRDGLQLQTCNDISYSLSNFQSRENCRCDVCTLKPSMQRNVNNACLIDESKRISIKDAHIDKQNKYIYLKWSDNHDGYIDVEELLNKTNQNYHIPWTSTPNNMTFNYNHDDIMYNDNTLLHSFYTELDKNGICLIRNSP